MYLQHNKIFKITRFTHGDLQKGLLSNGIITLLLETLLLVTLLLGPISCSLGSRSQLEPGAQRAVIEVSNRYLTNIAKGRLADVEGMILWVEYSSISDNRVERQAFVGQFIAMTERWKPRENPLVGVLITDIEVDDDDATISFASRKIKGAPPFWVKLRWIGRGWVVIGDSIFGDSQYLEIIASKGL